MNSGRSGSRAAGSPGKVKATPTGATCITSRPGGNIGLLPNILFVHYADLLADLGGEIQRIADFLAIPLPTTALPAVCEAVTLDSMRRRAKAEDTGINQVWHGGADTFFFQGTNGRWREVLSAAELALYEEKAVGMLTPECRTWLEQGRVAG